MNDVFAVKGKANDKISIITDLDGKQIVLINDIRFKARMLVRCDEKNKLYLYDLVQIKKETSTPLE